MPTFSVKQMKESLKPNYPRYVRNKKYKVPEHQNDPIQESCTAFYKRHIDATELRKVLTENKINPNIEEINKYVRGYEDGQDIKLNDLFFAVKKFQKNGIDPNDIKQSYEPPKFNGNTDAESDKSHLLNHSSKKISGNNHNASRKEMFDWDESQFELCRLKNEEKAKEATTKVKFAYESSIFKNDNNDETQKCSVKKIKGPDVDNGNILHWKGNKNSSVSVEQDTKKVRRDPNARSCAEEAPTKPRKILSSMHQSSEENSMVRAKN